MWKSYAVKVEFHVQFVEVLGVELCLVIESSAVSVEKLCEHLQSLVETIEKQRHLFLEKEKKRHIDASNACARLCSQSASK